MSYLLERDTVSGREGKAFMTLDGVVNELFGAKKVETSVDIQTEDMTVVGTRKVQQKPNGAKMSGTATVYYGTPLFIDMARRYVKGGAMPYFDMQVTNNDPTTTVGQQVVAYYNCKLTGTIPLSKLDADTTMLSIDISFTFDDFEVLQSFTDPASTGN